MSLKNDILYVLGDIVEGLLPYVVAVIISPFIAYGFLWFAFHVFIFIDKLFN